MWRNKIKAGEKEWLTMQPAFERMGFMFRRFNLMDIFFKLPVFFSKIFKFGYIPKYSPFIPKETKEFFPISQNTEDNLIIKFHNAPFPKTPFTLTIIDKNQEIRFDGLQSCFEYIINFYNRRITYYNKSTSSKKFRIDIYIIPDCEAEGNKKGDVWDGHDTNQKRGY